MTYLTPERLDAARREIRAQSNEDIELRTAELKLDNGSSALARGESCADRRAWTWEGRFTKPLDFADVQVAHHAGHMAREVIERFDTRARALPLMTAAGGEALYRASGPCSTS